MVTKTHESAPIYMGGVIKEKSALPKTILNGHGRAEISAPDATSKPGKANCQGLLDILAEGIARLILEEHESMDSHSKREKKDSENLPVG